jgi:glycosidase
VEIVEMIYQIFPERFAIGKPLDIRTKLSQSAYQRDGYVRHAAWDEEPTGGSDFFGGDLRGVIDHIEYIKDLGADAVYLTPIFTAYSNHKYDTVDYQSVDPMFGDECVLGELIDELHKRGMRLIMDAVLNHVGTEHPWFQAAKRGEVPYRDFFTFFADGNICAGGATTGCPNCASNILLSLGCAIEIPTACYSAGWRAVLIIGGLIRRLIWAST